MPLWKERRSGLVDTPWHVDVTRLMDRYRRGRARLVDAARLMHAGRLMHAARVSGPGLTDTTRLMHTPRVVRLVDRRRHRVHEDQPTCETAQGQGHISLPSAHHLPPVGLETMRRVYRERVVCQREFAPLPLI